MFRFWMLIMLYIGFSSAAVAQSAFLRGVAQREACDPFEKEYRDAKGDLVACAPAQSSGYQFEVYLGEKILWKGSLPRDRNEVRFDLPDEHQPLSEDGRQRVFLFFEQRQGNLAHHVSFGEGYFDGIELISDRRSAIEFPKIKRDMVDLSEVSANPSSIVLPVFPRTRNQYRVLVYSTDEEEKSNSK